MSSEPRSPRDTRSTIIRVVTFLGGIYFFLYFLAPESFLNRIGVTNAHESISNGFIAIGAMAIGLGIINIVMSHGARVIFVKQGWFFSAALLCGMCAMIGVTLGHWFSSRTTSAEIRQVQIAGEFAGRIIEDAKAGKGNEKSVVSHGVVPPLEKRVQALTRYTRDTIARTRQDLDRVRPYAAGDEGFQALVSEVQQASLEVEKVLDGAPSEGWAELNPQAEAILTQINQSAARLASTYAIVKRKVSSQSLISRLYDFLYNGVFNQLGSAMFALLGVYIAAAAYRAFRIRSVESALMMTAALIVMLGQISFGRLLYEDMPAIRQWLLEVPNSAAFRAIRLGAGVAGLLLAIRMWLSIESSAGSKGGKQ
jgi:hypothetical protein